MKRRKFIKSLAGIFAGGVVLSKIPEKVKKPEPKKGYPMPEDVWLQQTFYALDRGMLDPQDKRVQNALLRCYGDYVSTYR